MLGNTLAAANVFTAVALFTMLTGPLNAFPWVINGVVEAAVSIRRVSEYLSLPHFQRDAYYASSPMGDTEPDVTMTSAKLMHTRHSTTLQFKLADLTFTAEQGQVFAKIFVL